MTNAHKQDSGSIRKILHTCKERFKWQIKHIQTIIYSHVLPAKAF